MAHSFPPQSDQFLLPTTDEYDTDSITNINGASTEVINYLLYVRKTLNQYALFLNQRDVGYYSPTQTISGNIYPTQQDNQRSVYNLTEYRVAIDTGALPNTGTTTTAHNIDTTNGDIQFTRIIGAATNSSTSAGIPLPYVGTSSTEHISVRADATNIIIQTAQNWSAYDISTVTIQVIYRLN